LEKELQYIAKIIAVGGNFFSLIFFEKKEDSFEKLASFSIPDFPADKVEEFIEEFRNCDDFNKLSVAKLKTFEKLKEQFPDVECVAEEIGTENVFLLGLTSPASMTDTQTKVLLYGKELIIELLKKEKGKESGSELKRKIEETVNSISPIIYLTDVKGDKYYFITDSVKEMFGIEPTEIYKNRYLLMRSVVSEDFDKFRKFVRELKDGKRSEIEYRFHRIDGKQCYVRHTGTPIFENGKVARIAGIIYDITKEKELVNRLKKVEFEHDLLMKTAGGLVYTLDRSGYFISINELGAALLGYRKEDLIGRHFLEFIEEENKAEIAIAFQKILWKDSVVTFEARFIDHFGKPVFFEINALNIKRDGKISGMVGSGRNITERKTSEEKLKELNAKLSEANRIISIERNRAKEKISVLEELNKLKNDFISNVSHELRTPLASIVGFAETISTDADLPRETALEFNNIILTEGKRLAKLVNQILDFSKLEQDKEQLNISSFDLILMINEILDYFKEDAEKKGVKLVKEIPEAEMIIEADKERLKVAFGNLLSNSIKFTESGGSVSIIAQEFLKEVEIVISDTGIGISESEMPKLFQKFSKGENKLTQAQGTGFGLVSVKQIIDLHKGLIQIKSQVNKGTTVIIRLPKKIK